MGIWPRLMLWRPSAKEPAGNVCRRGSHQWEAKEEPAAAVEERGVFDGDVASGEGADFDDAGGGVA